VTDWLPNAPTVSRANSTVLLGIVFIILVSRSMYILEECLANPSSKKRRTPEIIFRSSALIFLKITINSEIFRRSVDIYV
jgi:hypothetical protein